LDAKTLILGCSRDARLITEELLETDGDVIVAIPGNRDDTVLFDDLIMRTTTGKLEVLLVAGNVSCSGSVGCFNLTFTESDEPLSRTVSSIIIADDVVRKPNFSHYGVTASKTVVSLSQFHEMLEPGTGQAKEMFSGKKIAFIMGLAEESNPVTTADVMNCALQTQQEFEGQTYIFTGNLKVAGNGLEARYRQTKKAGIVYMKFTETIPEFKVNNDDKLAITYIDEVLGEPFKFIPDLTVFDEALEPSRFSRDLSKSLEIDTGPDGFVQSDNVHRTTVFTNRKGIFVAGFSRGVQTQGQRQADVSSAALAVRSLYKHPPESTMGKAEIHYRTLCWLSDLFSQLPLWRNLFESKGCC